MQDMNSKKDESPDVPDESGPPPVYPDSCTPHPDSTELCGHAGPGHFHYESPDAPDLDGQLGNDRVVVYKHWLDTHCHGVVQWEWGVDLDDPSQPVVNMAQSDVEGLTGCEYCVLITQHAFDAASKQAFENWKLMLFRVGSYANGLVLEGEDEEPKSKSGALRRLRKANDRINAWLDGGVSE